MKLHIPLLAVMISCGSWVALGQLSNLTEEEKEILLRVEQESEMLESFGPVLDDSLQVAQVNRLLRTVTSRGTPYSPLFFRAIILRSSTPNAFSLANGRIYLTTGLLSHCNTEDELASILGHEIGHVVKRHLFMKIANARSTLDSRAGAAFMSLGIVLQSQSIASLAPQLSVLSLSGYSRELEAEADAYGVKMVSNLGFDPWDAVRVMERFQEIENDTLHSNRKADNGGGYYLRSHPSMADRIKAFKEMIKTSRTGQPGWDKQLSYCQRFYTALLENSRLALQFGDTSSLGSTLSKALAGNPLNPEGHFLAGEYFRQRSDSASLRTALGHYRRALIRDSTHANSFRSIGIVHLKLQNTQEAQRAFETYLSLKPVAEDRQFIERMIKGGAQ